MGRLRTGIEILAIGTLLATIAPPTEAQEPIQAPSCPRILITEGMTVTKAAEIFGTTNERIIYWNSETIGKHPLNWMLMKDGTFNVCLPIGGPKIPVIPGVTPTPVKENGNAVQPGSSPETADIFPFGEDTNLDRSLVIPPNSVTWYKLPTLQRDGRSNRYNIALGGDIQGLTFVAYGPENSPKNWWYQGAALQEPTFRASLERPDDPNWNGGNLALKGHFGQQLTNPIYKPDGTMMPDTNWYALVTNPTSSPKYVLARTKLSFQ